MAARVWMMEETKGRILFVDSDRDTCEMMRTILSQAGYETVPASSVTEGLRLARVDDFDLILLDWHFQDGTGVELCQMIRTFDSRTPIFFYTGMGIEGEAHKMRSAGAQGCFIKPVSVTSLVESISSYARGNGDGKI